MSQRPKKWPDYALNSLEGTLFHLKEVGKLAAAAEEELKNGDPISARNLVLDIRDRVVEAKSLLHQARTGDYEPAG